MFESILMCYVLFVLIYGLISLLAQTRYIKNLENESEKASKYFIDAINDLTKKIKE